MAYFIYFAFIRFLILLYIFILIIIYTRVMTQCREAVFILMLRWSHRHVDVDRWWALNVL